MAFHIHDEETDRLVRKLAAHEGVGLTQAVKLAVEERLRKREADAGVEAWLDDFYRRYPPPSDPTPLPKSFFDDLSGE